MHTHAIAADSYVHHGTLDVPTRAETLYESAKAYLCRDSVERELFERLEHETDGRRFCLRINHQNNDYFDPATNTIGWDPYSALRTTKGGRQSPALGLGHEVDHAVERSTTEARLTRLRDRRYDNREERRVIQGSETHAARTLGEDVRRDHGGETYRVSRPWAR